MMEDVSMETKYLQSLKECPIESEHALFYNAYKEYVKTGEVGDIGPTTIDMLWLLLYITGDTFYAEEVKHIGKNVMVASAALWSYNSHCSKPEMYGIPVLSSWQDYFPKYIRLYLGKLLRG